MIKKITLIILALLLSSSVFAVSSFNDVEENKWYTDWIDLIKDLKITNGYPDGSYRPNNKMTRAEVLSFAMKCLGHSDIPSGDVRWYDNVLEEAVTAGLVTRDPSDITYHDPDGYITREETARVFYNAYLSKNAGFNAEEDQFIRSTIADMDKVGDKYIQGVVGVVFAGIAEGYVDKTFKPQNNLTRAEVAVFATRLALKDKRLQVEFEISEYHYKSSNPKIPDFTLRYNVENQDLVNIHKLINKVENADTSNGFSELIFTPYTNMLLSSIYASEDLYNTPMPQIDLIQKRAWSIGMRLLEDPREYASDIEIITWRQNNAEDHLGTVKAVFDYLFESESEDIYNKYVYQMNNIPIKTYEYRKTINGREVILASDTIGVQLLVTKKKDAMAQ